MLLSKNRKALFNYEIIEKYITGIVLYGYEVKAIKEGNINFEGSYIKFENDGLYLINLYIGKYSKQSKIINHEFNPKRSRKLILNKKEIIEIQKELDQKGKTAIPLSVLIKNGKIKLEISTVKGKKDYEKKQVAKDKQIKKDLENQVKLMNFK